MCRRARHLGVPRAFAVLALLLASAPARASSATELVRMARVHEMAQEDDVAVRRYMEALTVDGACEEAYLGLGALRARRGDLREAERVYTVALDRLPRLRPARAARAHVRRALGLRREAEDDLLEGVEDEIAAWRVLASWRGEDAHHPAQLAAWRRVLVLAEAAQNDGLVREARRMVRALVLLVGTADPAAAPEPPLPGEPHSLRPALAVLAQRGSR